ncbi:N,N-dimethylformamidase beta subunit family domain-containing protein [Paenibacillus koleovorans]|uniref:N,N-dimethylformamidase beta subunit family domain-containing protein n=1 Tax=Paenibacillus koleovorans TaxID=121608 RepID=UPI000FDB5E90|nr:N,N-dimethylformamidase beta subunit family domain-containing protein [Paenibacillus koleovorans]
MTNKTRIENEHPGTLDWQITQFQYDYPEHLQASPIIRGLRSSAIEGYASRTSVYPGETLELMVSVQPEGRFEVDIYRLGYYGGDGGRHMLHMGPIEGRKQRMPMETVERLRECGWEPSVTLTVPDDWTSGVYLAKLTREEMPRLQSYAIFIVKARRKTKVLVQVSDLTWQAYNKWPATNSIYDDGSPEMWYQGAGVRVSFDRPYAKYCQIVDAPLSCGSGEFLLWEFPLAYWLEAEGYDVTYCSNLDTHADPDLLMNAEVFISVGHDEYWTREMYENVTRARDAGVSLLFLSGNALYHEIVTYGATEKEPFRSFARQRYFPDERELMGASSFGPGYGDWTVAKPDHWVFEGTGMKAGDRIPGLIGWEYHGEPFKDVDGLEVLARSELIGLQPGEPDIGFAPRAKGDGKHAAVIYPGPRGNWVFNAGTIWWAEALSAPPGHIPAMGALGRTQGPDRRVQQITRNLLARCLK